MLGESVEKKEVHGHESERRIKEKRETAVERKKQKRRKQEEKMVEENKEISMRTEKAGKGKGKGENETYMALRRKNSPIFAKVTLFRCGKKKSLVLPGFVT